MIFGKERPIMRLPRKMVAMIVLFSIVFWVMPSVFAHTRVEVGPYAVVVGWLVEPPVVGERNAVIVEISEDEQPVIGLEGSLDIEFLYGGRNFRANLNPTDTPGLYTAEVFPTVRGQYAVRLFGNIEGLSVDEILEPEEVFPASRIQFPEPEPDVRELVQRVDLMEQELQSSRTFAFAGIGIGVIGFIIAIVSVILGRRK
ncbi:MAG: hypothetical protein GY943_08945 [Chloroflexi bacterium]|nr:hypothetical protein [Chloroflexota bacterium]